MTPRLAVNELTLRYGPRTIVDRASFAIGGPGVVAIIGPNGSGKTTLLRALLGLLPVAEGTIAWSGDAAVIRDPTSLAKHAAYLAQTPSAVAGQSVGQAIISGRFVQHGVFDFFDAAEDTTRVAAIANELELSDLLSRPIESLSGGQRQRVFLGRCLAQETPTLLLDEPATFLDLRHQLDLYQHLRRLARLADKTVLMASHDLNLAATHADRMLVMDAGNIVADGPPAEILTPDLLQRVYGVAMKRVDIEGEPHFIVARATSP